jgi:hypothetical protein
MRVFTFFHRIFFSEWFLAAIPAVVFILFLPPVGSKYKILIQEKGKSYSTDYYTDLNSDGITEMLRTGKGVPYYFVTIMDNDYHVYDQINYKDQMDAKLGGVIEGNYDNDRYKEIYVFTHRGDSLFLNINEPFDPNGLKDERTYLTSICTLEGELTSTLSLAGFFDYNGDGFKEIYFSVLTGFGVTPRSLYCYDIQNNSLKEGRKTGEIFQFPYFTDVDGDNRPEIFGIMIASGNLSDSVEFNDRSAWFMVYNDSLNFKFPPVEFPGLTNTLQIFPYTNDSFKGFLLSLNSQSADTTVLKPRIMIYSKNGKFVKERAYSDFGFNKWVMSSIIRDNNSDRVYLFEKDFLELDSNLNIKNKVKSNFNSLFIVFNHDFNFNGENELVLWSQSEGKMSVYTKELKLLAETKVKSDDWYIRFSHSISSNGEKRIFLNTSDNGYFIKLEKKKLFFLGYFIYPVIYLFCLLFILLVKRINTLKVEKKEKLKHRLVTLQLQGIKAQLDPHFTFNTLNSIASLVYLDDRHTAYDYLTKFTVLLRGMLNDADRIYRNLSEEITFVSTYLDLEKLRFGERFNYEINIGADITQKELVPKLVLQTFAENAIKHGILPLSEGGLLKISVVRETDYLKLSVEDNGIGREKSIGTSTSTGKGLNLTWEFYDILNQINKRQIRYLVTDLFKNDGTSAGTRVEVWVPVD